MADTKRQPPIPGISERDRFVMELEFVQSLANPHYLHYLATHQYFDDDAFFNYLKYLEYWKKEPYVTYIRFPMCLLMMNLLHDESFRRTVTSFDGKERLAVEQGAYYSHYLANRIKEAANKLEGQELPAKQQQQ
eukprot:GHUV01000928.1.p1 GENE.GHUV01000928.1~~GHUV01000928.1.p1  ORF type:complete len:134 (+),score=39.30 GHUV01000928.1:134-535(+)